MSVELACEKCQGRFLVAAPGTVACPHCGIHLSVTAEAFPDQTDENLSGESSPPSSEDHPQPNTETQESEKFQNYAGLPHVAQSHVAKSQPAESDNLASPPQSDSVSTPETINHGESVQTEDLQVDVPAESIELPTADSVSASGIEQPKDASAEAVGLEQPDDLDSEAMTITIAEFNKSENEAEAAFAPTETFDLPTADTPTEAFESSAANAPTEELESSVPIFDESSEAEVGPNEFPDFSASPEETGTADIDPLDANADFLPPNLDEQPAVLNDQLPVIDDPPPPTATTGDRTRKTIQPGVSRQSFLILASYASAMTIVCLWLLLRMMSGVDQLENLSDPAETQARGKKKVVRVYPVDIQLPRGHELQIGDHRQFGHIVVEPLKVSRGRLDFVRFDGEQGMEKESTGPVLKLWLRFKNVSDEQIIAPLDSILLYSNRIRNKQNYEEFHANNFVVGRDISNKPVGKLLHVYDMNTNDVWDLKDQQLGKELKPGESCVIYVPTGEKDIDKLNGSLVWRLHFRKGYSPSNRGVTTLIDIKFDSTAIQTETPQPVGQSTASL